MKAYVDAVVYFYPYLPPLYAGLSGQIYAAAALYSEWQPKLPPGYETRWAPASM